jgi:hypothetical protein
MVRRLNHDWDMKGVLCQACSGVADILAATPAPKVPEPPPDAGKLPV